MNIKSKNKVLKIQQKLFEKNIIISAIYKCKIVYVSKRLKSNDAMTTCEFSL